MADTLEIFGTEYTNVAGIIATDDNGNDLTYTRGGDGGDFVTLYYEPYEEVNGEPVYYWVPDKTFEEIAEAYIEQGSISIIADVDSYDTYTYIHYDSILATGSLDFNYGVFLYSVALPHTNDSSKYTITYYNLSYLDELYIANTQELNSYVLDPNPVVVTPATSQQIITPDFGYDGLTQVTVNAMPVGTAGTPTATKGSVINNSVTITPSVTNTTGYITGSTVTGTAVTVTASELISFVTYYTGSTDPGSSQGSNGDIYLKVV